MNYIEEIMQELFKELPDCPPELISYYTLLAYVKGTETTMRDIHDAWSIWQNEFKDPKHPSLIPFGLLPKEKQELDQPYMEAVKKVVKRMS